MNLVTHPPANGGNDLVIVWHMLDVPDSAEAMAAALALNELNAWKVYLPLPMPAQREDMDPVLDFLRPVADDAVAAFPAQLEQIRRELPVGDGSVKLVGASISAMVALSVSAQADAVALISPAVQFSRLVAANEKMFGMTYPWPDEAKAVAERLDFVARAPELAARGIPILQVLGEDDDKEFRAPAEQLWQALSGHGEPGRYSLVTIPGMGHALDPETDFPAKVDGIVSDWLARH